MECKFQIVVDRGRGGGEDLDDPPSVEGVPAPTSNEVVSDQRFEAPPPPHLLAFHRPPPRSTTDAFRAF